MGFADESVRAAIMGVRAVSPAFFPGSEPPVPIGIRALTEAEIDEARLEAQSYFDRVCKMARLDLLRFLQLDPDTLEREHQRQCVARAVLDPGADAVPFFQDASQVRNLTSVQFQRLWDLYEDHQANVSPRPELNPEQATELCEALKKKQEQQPLLIDFDRSTLASLVRTLVAQLSA